MHLVDNHMLEFLIIDRAKVRIRFVRLPSDPRREHVLSTVVESVLNEQSRHVFHFRTSETSLAFIVDVSARVAD